MTDSRSAPIYTVPLRKVVAVEHPMMIKNIDKGLKTFPTTYPFNRLLQGTEEDSGVPIYLRVRDPTAVPIVSHNTATNNVLLKIVLPKKTGRKRKRGSQDPYLPEEIATSQSNLGGQDEQHQATDLKSHSRLDRPQDLLSGLRDNVNNYKIDVVGVVEQTHRYRGVADFHHSTTHPPFMSKVRDTILSGKWGEVKKFQLDPSTGVKPNSEVVPPPSMSDFSLPFNYGYRQNSSIKIDTDDATGVQTLVNRSSVMKVYTAYVANNTRNLPTCAPIAPPSDPILTNLIQELSKAFDERPIWTRRALQNHVGNLPGIYLFKTVIQYLGYQFRGGPWRDSIIRYGFDPRIDPKYRIYQTLFFKIYDVEDRGKGRAWQDLRSEYTRRQFADKLRADSHLFDGRSISVDGKIWQLCDVTDPLVRKLIDNAPLRETCDIHESGWFQNGVYAKIKTVMRAKITAIMAGQEIQDHQLAATLAFPDHVPGKNKPQPPMPNLNVKTRTRAAPVPKRSDDKDLLVPLSYNRKRVGQGVDKATKKTPGGKEADTSDGPGRQAGTALSESRLQHMTKAANIDASGVLDGTGDQFGYSIPENLDMLGEMEFEEDFDMEDDGDEDMGDREEEEYENDMDEEDIEPSSPSVQDDDDADRDAEGEEFTTSYGGQYM